MSGWIHKDTVIDGERGAYFIAGFYGDGEPTFRTLQEARDFIDAVRAAEVLPERWQDFIAATAKAGV